MVAKKDIDWGNLGFSYHVTDKRYVSMYQDGKWDDGALISDDKIVMSEDAGVLQYSQSVFEGLKAYETEDGHIVCFRPDLNAQRMYDSALRLEMPPFPVDRFVEAVKETVRANEAWVPPYGTGATLYTVFLQLPSALTSRAAQSPSLSASVILTARPREEQATLRQVSTTR